MNETQKIKINRFLSDTVMSDAVRQVLLDSFMKPKALSDVNLLAASRIAIDLLQEGWRELEKHRSSENKESVESGNVGL